MALAHRHPVSTYRLQFRPGFGFADACNILPYLADLGVTDCYVSPVLKSTPGSLHGYDICDHSRVNPDLGSQAEFEAWCAALRLRGMGHIVDFVPNHMACDPVSNAWWRDVLENGPSSPFAKYFDIDWDPVKPELKNKVLLPLLGDQYGRVLERGELQLQFQDGALHLGYFDRDLPINPRQSPRVLGARLDVLQRRLQGQPALREYLSILTALQNLPVYTEGDANRIVERQREKEVARERLARLTTESPDIKEYVDSVVRLANGIVGDPDSFDLLHTLLEHQAYRLAYWRTAFDEINYRRFFDINELVGLRMEDPTVFEATHARLRQMISCGDVTGLRIDHPDGLFDPAQYFDRVQQMAAESRPEPPGHGAEPFYIAAEKILSEGESLRRDWAVAGTTGYSFLNAVAGLFIDGRNVQRLRRVYGRLTARQTGFADVTYDSKRTILLTAMASELNVVAHALNRLSERDRRHRDFTLNTCRTVVREVIACFPVYRTYVSERGVDPFDRAVVSTAIRQARRRNPLMESSIFDFLEEVLLTDPSSTADDPEARERLSFAMKFQQFTGPVQAKGVEDTAFYRYHVLAAVNDVGGHPARLGVSPGEFHDANVARLQLWPNELITTATHDTKRGEDARMRIAVLSEIPDIWRHAVSAWMRANGRHRTKLASGWAPDRNDEYLFYQTLIGVWPPTPEGAPIPDQAPADLVARVNAYMQKAIREAKVHTSWIDEDQAYGRAVTRFVERSLTDKTSVRFLRSFVPLQRFEARAGRDEMNSGSRVSLRWPVLVLAAVVFLAIGGAAAYVGLRLRARSGLPSEQTAVPKAGVPPVGPATDRAASSPETSAPLPDVVTLSREAVERAGITSTAVSAGPTSGGVRAPGVVEANAYKQIVVTPVISGRITRVAADLGQHVQRGQTLAQIFSPELAEAQTRYISARADLEADEKELARTEKLVAIGAASRQELERIHAGHTARLADVESAASRLQLLGLFSEAIEGLGPGKNQGATTNIPAPIAGVITERLANVGLNVDQATKLFTVVDLSSVWVVANLYEKDFARVRVGSPATVTTNAYPELVLQGRVSYIDPQVSPETRTAKVRIEVPNPRNDLRLGMYAEALLGDSAGVSMPMVPREAVQNVGGRTVVYLVNPKEPGTFVERDVRLGSAPGDRVSVLAGVHIGDVVVGQGSFSVRAERERLGLRAAPVSADGAAGSTSSPPPGAAPADMKGEEVRVTVDETRFNPQRFTLRAGVPARVTFTRTSDKTCATAVVFPSLNIRRELPLNEPVTIQFTPDKAGEIAFACGMNMLRGTIVVQ